MSVARLTSGVIAAVLPLLALLPVLPVRAQVTEPLRVMTYNINHGGAATCQVEPPSPVPDCGAAKIHLIALAVREQNPDVIGVQELDRFWARSGFVDQPALLAEELGMSYCFGANLKHGPDEHSIVDHEYGTAIMSRFPIDGCTNTLLPKADPRTEQRGLLEAVVTASGARLPVYTTHLQNCTPGISDPCGPNNPDRTAQTQAIASHIGTPREAVLAGDLNAQPGWPELRPIERRLNDVWVREGQGNGYTYPARLSGDPTRRIDYIFVRGIRVLSAAVPITVTTRAGSDHYPVIAELSQPGSGSG